MKFIDDYPEDTLLSDIPEDDLVDFVKTTDPLRNQVILKLKNQITLKELKNIMKFNKFQGKFSQPTKL